MNTQAAVQRVAVPQPAPVYESQDALGALKVPRAAALSLQLESNLLTTVEKLFKLPLVDAQKYLAQDSFALRYVRDPQTDQLVHIALRDLRDPAGAREVLFNPDASVHHHPFEGRGEWSRYQERLRVTFESAAQHMVERDPLLKLMQEDLTGELERRVRSQTEQRYDEIVRSVADGRNSEFAKTTFAWLKKNDVGLYLGTVLGDKQQHIATYLTADGLVGYHGEPRRKAALTVPMPELSSMFAHGASATFAVSGLATTIGIGVVAGAIIGGTPFAIGMGIAMALPGLLMAQTLSDIDFVPTAVTRFLEGFIPGGQERRLGQLVGIDREQLATLTSETHIRECLQLALKDHQKV